MITMDNNIYISDVTIITEGVVRYRTESYYSNGTRSSPINILYFIVYGVVCIGCWFVVITCYVTWLSLLWLLRYYVYVVKVVT